MPVAHIKIRGGRIDAPTRGQDVGVFIVDADGRETAIPALSLTLKVEARSNRVHVVIDAEVAAVEFDGLAELERGATDLVDGEGG